MLAIPGNTRRGKRKPLPLNYVPFARATWEWWCGQNGIRFIYVHSLPIPAPNADLPVQVKRWMMAHDLLASGKAEQIAVVDADTMIRWDTPDFFSLCGNTLGAVPDRKVEWVSASIAGYQPLFPDVTLDPGQYFNSGLVVFSRGHAGLLREFGTFYAARLDEILRIGSREEDIGIDQTLLNFVARHRGVVVTPLPETFNMLHCIHSLPDFRDAPVSDATWQRVRQKPQFDRLFEYIDQGYLWH